MSFDGKLYPKCKDCGHDQNYHGGDLDCDIINCPCNQYVSIAFSTIPKPRQYYKYLEKTNPRKWSEEK
jgi:hypothetical protein